MPHVTLCPSNIRLSIPSFTRITANFAVIQITLTNKSNQIELRKGQP